MNRKSRLSHTLLGICLAFGALATADQASGTIVTSLAKVTQDGGFSLQFNGPDPTRVEAVHRVTVSSIDPAHVGRILVRNYIDQKGFDTPIYDPGPTVLEFHQWTVPSGTYGATPGNHTQAFIGDCHSLAINYTSTTHAELQVPNGTQIDVDYFTALCGCQFGPSGAGDPYH